MAAVKLRDRQIDALEAAWKELQRVRSTLVIMPTGAGKTLVFTKLMERWIKEYDQRALVLVPRRWLVDNAVNEIRETTRLKVGVEMGGRSMFRTRKLSQVVCGTWQSIAARCTKVDRQAFGLIVIDEADLAMSPSYRKILDHFGEAKVFGCTATPSRGDGIPLANLFESVAHRSELVELVRAKELASIKRQAVKVLDLSRIRTLDGDFDPKQLDEVLQSEKHLHEVVKPTLELSEHRPTVVFGVSIKHAEMLTEVFNRYRPGCARVIHSKSAEREETLRDFRANRFQFLVNVEIIGRGIDIPKIACISMARPTKSLTLYMQAIGRGTRKSPGKDDLLVIDFTSNSEVYGLIDTIDALGGRSSQEEIMRAKELAEENPGSNVMEMIDRATQELAEDETLRERVRAKVLFQNREVVGIDWDTVDLTRPTKELVEELGCHEATIRQAKRKRGFGAAREYKFINWDLVKDWNRPVKEIAEETGCTEATARQAKRRRGLIIKQQRINWDTVDLTRSTKELAKELGCHEATIRKAKRKHGLTKSQFNWNVVENWNRSNTEIAKEMRCSERSVLRARKRREESNEIL